jgi:hypothetical protein
MTDPILKKYPFIMSAINGILTPPELTPKSEGVYVIYVEHRVLWTGVGKIQERLDFMFKEKIISEYNPDSFSFIECPSKSLQQEYEKWLCELKPLLDNPHRI